MLNIPLSTELLSIQELMLT